MAVISVTPSEARKLDGPTDMYANSDYYDYSERRSISLSIPDFHSEEKNGEKYIVSSFWIRMS